MCAGVAPRRPLDFDPIREAARNWEGAGWSAATPGMAFVTSISRVHQVLMARIDEVLSPFGLTFARFEVLMLLSFSRRGALPLGKIGQRLQVHAASVTNAIDRLEAQGFVRRTPHPDDGRTTLAVLTPVGRRTVERAATALNREVFTEVGLDGEQLTRVVDVLAELRRRAGDFT